MINLHGAVMLLVLAILLLFRPRLVMEGSQSVSAAR
jgi:hypothetical protein